MGNFYTNYTLAGPSQREVVEALAGRSAIVTPSQGGCVVVFDEQSDTQDKQVITSLAARLSQCLACPVLAVLNHDDDILWYQLYSSGELTDEYDSSPGYFDPMAESAIPVGGDAFKLCSAFGASDISTVENVLRKPSYGDDGYTFAFERHADLVRALGITAYSVGAGYDYVADGELPEGLEADDLTIVV